MYKELPHPWVVLNGAVIKSHYVEHWHQGQTRNVRSLVRVLLGRAARLWPGISLPAICLQKGKITRIMTRQTALRRG